MTLPQKLQQRVEQLAEEHEVSLSQVIRWAVKRYIKENPRRDDAD